ncbi:MAG TPA: NAD(P)H-binding protein [Terriglobales bacterium]|nr:NAD(P)H-binding protein [Terriglobales bacterium]
MDSAPSHVFITGGTGYIGSRLIPRLLARGHKVSALIRTQSQGKLPPGCQAVSGSALDAASYRHRIRPATAFVQLVGVPHPSPAKAAQFRSIDLVAGRKAVEAAVFAGIQHFVYVSVAQPAPMMKEYLEVRAECEAAIRESGLHATILRPWYVLGPGHRWPYALIPAYWLFERIPATRDGARRLGLVTLEQMLQALTCAVASPPPNVRVLGVPEIRSSLAAIP